MAKDTFRMNDRPPAVLRIHVCFHFCSYTLLCSAFLVLALTTRDWCFHKFYIVLYHKNVGACLMIWSSILLLSLFGIREPKDSTINYYWIQRIFIIMMASTSGKTILRETNWDPTILSCCECNRPDYGINMALALVVSSHEQITTNKQSRWFLVKAI